MHDSARSFVARIVSGRQFGHVVEVGGRNINGGVVDLIDYTRSYTSLDLYDGPGVDVVTDVRDWTPPHLVDLVICCEVLEHADDPAGVVKSCLAMLAPGGLFVMTCAGPGRAPHSGHDGGPVRPDEHYANIEPADMHGWLAGLDQVLVEHIEHLGDLYATATMRAAS